MIDVKAHAMLLATKQYQVVSKGVPPQGGRTKAGSRYKAVTIAWRNLHPPSSDDNNDSSSGRSLNKAVRARRCPDIRSPRSPGATVGIALITVGWQKNRRSTTAAVGGSPQQGGLSKTVYIPM